MNPAIHSVKHIKIYITGPSGSGKTYLARRLAEQLSLSPIDVDDLWLAYGGARFYHKPPWYRRVAKRELQRRVGYALGLAMQAPGWIIDNNYDFVGELIVSEADVAIILELPLRDLVINAWRRHQAGEKQYQGYTDMDFWSYLPTSIIKLRAKRRMARQTAMSAKRVVRLTSRAEIEAFVATTR